MGQEQHEQDDRLHASQPVSITAHAAVESVGTDEDLMALISRAAALEHRLACAFQFVACSLKNDASEGGLTAEQAATVRSWKRQLGAAAVERMLRLAQLANLLSALGGALQLARPTFPVPIVEVTSAAGLKGLMLEPFSQSTLDRLAVVTRPASTVHANLYSRITTAIKTLPADAAYFAHPEWQTTLLALGIGHDQLTAVTDRATAIAALARIAGGEAFIPPADDIGTSSVVDTMRTEYAALSAAAQQAAVPFEPVRRVASTPTTKAGPNSGLANHIRDVRTREVADLFNGVYDTLLLLLGRLVNSMDESAADRDQLARAGLQLLSGVLRPLGEALAQMPLDSASQPDLRAGPPFGDPGILTERSADLSREGSSALAVVAERLWQLASAATVLCMSSALPAEVLEATAALQDLACQLAPVDGPQSAAAKLAMLKELQASAGRSIRVAVNGPYLLTNVEHLYNWLGERIQTRPLMALCRCGASASKPFCDGTHARIEFVGAKDPKRVPDRRDTYVGEQVTIFDNRGICAHSGFCTDRLATVFRSHEDPYVAPSGGRMDDIIRTIRACPSGALSYAIGEREAREQVDWDGKREAAIEVSRDGPYRITGGLAIALIDEQGHDVPRNTGASREHYSLCRCGHSQNKPFCSGMHWYVDFRDPAIAIDHEATLFEWAGGLPALRRMTRIFYEKYVPQEPLLAPLFANMSPDHPERVAAWLGEVFGGPKNYSERYGGYVRMLSQHIGKGITEAQRARWATLIAQSADDAGLPADADFRAAFVAYVEWGSRLAVENSTPGAHPPPQMPMPRWWWVCNATPWGRVSALAPELTEEEPAVLPNADQPVHFEPHVRSLFRERDRQSMKFAFDLWSYDDVTTHAADILTHVRAGSMPCDGAWPQERVDVFQRWVDAGMPR